MAQYTEGLKLKAVRGLVKPWMRSQVGLKYDRAISFPDFFRSLELGWRDHVAEVNHSSRTTDAQDPYHIALTDYIEETDTSSLEYGPDSRKELYTDNFLQYLTDQEDFHMLAELQTAMELQLPETPLHTQNAEYRPHGAEYDAGEINRLIDLWGRKHSRTHDTTPTFGQFLTSLWEAWKSDVEELTAGIRGNGNRHRENFVHLWRQYSSSSRPQFWDRGFLAFLAKNGNFNALAVLQTAQRIGLPGAPKHQRSDDQFLFSDEEVSADSDDLVTQSDFDDDDFDDDDDESIVVGDSDTTEVDSPYERDDESYYENYQSVPSELDPAYDPLEFEYGESQDISQDAPQSSTPHLVYESVSPTQLVTGGSGGIESPVPLTDSESESQTFEPTAPTGELSTWSPSF
jgi:hypothetical protein